ncbi:MAG: tetratricopeptide repeat protein [Rhodopseudomonas sp.]|nr:tetratricopeptide repeat protein [Rhodopseudomonas sp.]
MSLPDKLMSDAIAALNGRQFDKAEKLFRRVLDKQPGHIAALNLLTVVLMSQQRFAEAERFVAKAVMLHQSSDVSFYNYGLISKHLNKPQQALVQFGKALELNPNVSESWNNRGTVLSTLQRHDEAIADFSRAIALNPEIAGPLVNRGKSLSKLKRYEEALADFDKAIAVDPNSAEAWLGRGNIFNEQRRHDEAFDAYARALALNPTLAGVEGARLFSKMNLCDWRDYDADCAHLLASIADRLAADPFTLLSLPCSPEEQLRYARAFNKENYAPPESAVWTGQRHDRPRIRVAYLSGDLRDHPVAYLLAGVFERHDRARFETVAVSFGPRDTGAMRVRLEKAFDRFVDVGTRGDGEVVRMLRDLDVDIAVDLMGYTAGASPGILAHRPAPIQVNYLGYAGTLGADYIDYLIGDPVLIPPERHRHYAEKIVTLPNSYMPNDSRRAIADKPIDRAAFGLPADSFVFCCFNNNYKINPASFDRWMDILKQCDGSVLWLSEGNATATANLRRQAEAKGVDPSRLIFAKRVPDNADHLARLALADLFLDTLPYNAHATANDALWAGLPVLTLIGETFAGRVAASLLSAAGLSELIVTTPQAYIERAVGLYNDRTALMALRQRLASDRPAKPLFDTARYTHDLEFAFEAMMSRHRDGLPPDHIDVALHGSAAGAG